MADQVSPERRSEIMRRITGRDTAPEMAVRRLLHRMGLRFRLYRKDLPGKPDVVLPRWKVVILVHGCFWHGHDCSPKVRRPKSNTAYWNPKIERNMRRDAENVERLRSLGWSPVVIWACETRDLTALEGRLRALFAPGGTP